MYLFIYSFIYLFIARRSEGFCILCGVDLIADI